MVGAEVVNFETVSINWNAVWGARARVTAFGWTAELLIPWQALRYRRGTDVWGLNCERLIRRKNESVLWRAWGRTEGILFLPHEGTAAGFAGLPPRRIAELRPYAAVTARGRELRYPPEGRGSRLTPGDRSLNVGADAKAPAPPTLTPDLTPHPDFAPIEAHDP